jgi:antitoxin component of MazEF toxin-antitoxin module
MPQIRVRERNQITLPNSIAAAANVSADDILDVSFVNGVIMLVPNAAAGKRRSIMDYVGIAPGLWGTTASAIDDQIRSERDSWER